MGNKDSFRWGTFIKNIVLSKAQYHALALELGIDKQTDPEYVLEEVENNAPEYFEEIIELAKKTNNVKDCVVNYLGANKTNERNSISC